MLLTDGRLNACYARSNRATGGAAFLLACARAELGDAAVPPSAATLPGLYVGHASQVNDELAAQHPEGLVPLPLAFDAVQPEEMYVYDYLLFHAKTHGPGPFDRDYRRPMCDHWN